MSFVRGTVISSEQHVPGQTWLYVIDGAGHEYTVIDYPHSTNPGDIIEFEIPLKLREQIEKTKVK